MSEYYSSAYDESDFYGEAASPPTPKPEPQPEQPEFGICTCCQDIEVQGKSAIGCSFCKEDGREGPICGLCYGGVCSNKFQYGNGCGKQFCHRHGYNFTLKDVEYTLCRSCMRKGWTGSPSTEINYDYCHIKEMKI